MMKICTENKLYILKKFISKYWSYKTDKLNINTTLDDIGMYGDDKYDFIIAFAKEFNINLSNIKFERYVEPEPTMLTHIDTLYRFLFNQKLTSKFDVESITIGELLDIIEEGKWIN